MIANKKILWPLFILMVSAQLAVPSWMIYNKRMIAREGQLYKFELEARDPNDPFRGKYITLNPKENTFYSKQNATYNEKMYATFEIDNLGYAKVKDLSSFPPSDDDYLKVRAYTTSQTKDSLSKITIIYPFDRYYMNESIALAAEKLSVAAMRDRTKTFYAEVAIRAGQSNLLAVKVDGVPIEEILGH